MLKRLLVHVLAFLVVSYLLPGFVIENFFTAIASAFVLGILNTFLKPLLSFLTLPLTLLTFGLFSFILNVLLLLLTSLIVPGFYLSGFLTACLASLMLSLISSVLYSLTK